MGFFGGFVGSFSGGGDGGTPVDPANLPKVFEYYEVANSVSQEIWDIPHSGFNPSKDKLLIYINSVFVTPGSWELLGNENEGYRVRVPIEIESEITTPPTLDILVLTNTVGIN